MESTLRVSTEIAVAAPPLECISFSTVLMVDSEEFGSGKVDMVEASEVLFAATTTGLF